MTVFAWGNNQHGELALGVKPGSDTYAKLTPQKTLFPDDTTLVTPDYFASMAMAPGRTPEVVGGGLYGQRCDGEFSEHWISTPKATLLPPLSALAINGAHGVACLPDGSLRTFGGNSWGTIGNGLGAEGRENAKLNICTPYTPVRSGSSPAIAVAAGTKHIMVLDFSGWVEGCGFNKQGAIGDGTTVERYTLTAARLSTVVTAIAAGGQHSLYLSDGRVWANGMNHVGQLGLGDVLSRPTPTILLGVRDVVAIAAAGEQSYAIDAEGRLWEWGNGVLTPRLSGLINVAGISTGAAYALAIAGGEVYARGQNIYGELGDGTREPKHTWTAIGLQASFVAAGEIHSLAIG